MAIAEAHLAARHNRPDFPVVDHHTYALVSDGDLMEGVSHEAASLAGHLGLGKLICLYDCNGISIDGPTALSFTEDVAARFVAYRWHVEKIDGHDMVAVDGYVGPGGVVVGLDRFGASTPSPEIYQRLGLTAEAVAAAALRVLGRGPER